MRNGQSSDTAEYNALFRALEHERTNRLFDDPLARLFLSRRLRSVANAARLHPAGTLARRFIDTRWPGVRTSVTARTRFIDDLAASACTTVDQIVILGAGFDTRAHRIEAFERCDIFEIDHPDTQRRKRQVIANASEVDDAHVTYVSIDFDTLQLADAIDDTNLDLARPTLIIWEGVTNYLTEAAVRDTLGWCSTAAAGSQLIFTYINADLFTHPERYDGADRLRASLERSGEQQTFGIVPDDTPTYLEQLGLGLISDTGAAEYRAAQYGSEAKNMRGHEFYRVAHALVAHRVNETASASRPRRANSDQARLRP